MLIDKKKGFSLLETKLYFYGKSSKRNCVVFPTNMVTLSHACKPRILKRLKRAYRLILQGKSRCIFIVLKRIIVLYMYTACISTHFRTSENLHDFLSYRYIYVFGQLFVIFDIIITTIIFIPIVVIYLYLNTFFVLL